MLPLTWFMVAGACNAFNLIDGTHGLAGGTALIMFGGIALAAGWSGDALTLAEALAVMGALVGFLLWNYPRGRVFLGDAGAYFIGFMYAELSIQLVARNSDISAWYVIMLAGYPIVDTLFAMYRRGFVQRVPLMAPDALHLHSLVFRRVAMPIERRLKGSNLRRANARVAPRLWLHSALCFALAVIFHDNTPALWIGLAAYAAFYVNRYRALVRFGRRQAGGGASVERRWVAERGVETWRSGRVSRDGPDRCDRSPSATRVRERGCIRWRILSVKHRARHVQRQVDSRHRRHGLVRQGVRPHGAGAPAPATRRRLSRDELKQFEMAAGVRRPPACASSSATCATGRACSRRCAASTT